MTKESKATEVEKAVIDKLQEIISIEGNIKKYSKFGNSIIIVFDNGKYYHQPFISLYSSKATLDVLPLSNSKELKPTVEYSRVIKTPFGAMVVMPLEDFSKAVKNLSLPKQPEESKNVCKCQDAVNYTRLICPNCTPKKALKLKQ